jgi:nucleosome assembly protein 1-like 1
MGKKTQKEVEPESDEEEEECDATEEEEVIPGEAVAHAFVHSLNPTIRDRIYALRKLNADFTKAEEEMHKEIATLDTRYAALYKPHHDRRRDIVTGKTQPTRDEVEKGSKIIEIEDVDESGKDTKKEEAKAEPAGPKGIPEFWLRALSNCPETGETITERDEAALKFLEDIEVELFENANDGFRLRFKFTPNEFFNNTELLKTYHYVMEDGDVMVDRSEGTAIEWKDGKNLTVEQVKKKQKKGKAKKWVTVEEPCESFFNYFRTVTEEEDDDGSYEEYDLEISNIIRDKIVPNAINWYTGAAITPMRLDMSPDDDDEDDENEEDDRPKKQKGDKPGGKGQECQQQ